MATMAKPERGISGNFQQKKFPVNPISYMNDRGISSIFRYVQTHPDMDHMDGIEALFHEFSPTNFWDTGNTKEMQASSWEGSPYRASDWKFYKHLRDTDPDEDPRRLTLYSGARGPFYNQGRDGAGGGDGLHVLAPTKELVAAANEADEDYNRCSYVVLYLTGGQQHRVRWRLARRDVGSHPRAPQGRRHRHRTAHCAASRAKVRPFIRVSPDADANPHVLWERPLGALGLRGLGERYGPVAIPCQGGHRARSFQILTSGDYDNFFLFSVFINDTSGAAIVAVNEGSKACGPLSCRPARPPFGRSNRPPLAAALDRGAPRRPLPRRTQPTGVERWCPGGRFPGRVRPRRHSSIVRRLRAPVRSVLPTVPGVLSS